MSALLDFLRIAASGLHPSLAPPHDEPLVEADSPDRDDMRTQADLNFAKAC
jgi:hypothetical protein